MERKMQEDALESKVKEDILDILSYCINCRFCLPSCPRFEITTGDISEGASGITRSLYYAVKWGETDKKILKISKILLFGNFIISIPVIIGFVMMFTGNHYLIAKIESVMCKFAFFYAVCLSIAVLYNYKGKDERDNPEYISDN